jgi:hypothetical protein
MLITQPTADRSIYHKQTRLPKLSQACDFWDDWVERPASERPKEARSPRSPPLRPPRQQKIPDFFPSVRPLRIGERALSLDKSLPKKLQN